MSGLFRSLVLASALMLCAVGAQATGALIPHGVVELIAEDQWVAPEHDLNLGLSFELEDGWHIYWINPGDSGEPPRVTWRLPAGLSVGATEWPAPRRLKKSSVVDFGYEDAVMLIVPMHADTNLTAQQSMKIGADLRVLVCREICIPGKAEVSITLPVKAQPPSPDRDNAGLFSSARKSLPRTSPGNWKLNVDDTSNSFMLTANLGHTVRGAVFFPLIESQVDNAAPQKAVPLDRGFRLRLRKSDQLVKPVQRLQGVLVLSPDKAYLIDVPLRSHAAAKSSPQSASHKSTT